MRTHLLLRYFLICTLLLELTPTYLTAYDEDVLKIFSKVLPRFVLMSQLKEQLNEELTICILHDALDKKVATRLADEIQRNYPDGLQSYSINVTSYNYNQKRKCKNPVILFLLDSSEKNINQTVNYFSKDKILTASYSAQFLENGIDISMFIGRKILPYINIQTIRKKDIELDNKLLRISKIYQKVSE